MAKLKKDPITAENLLEFVNSDSDFGFEMRVLKILRSEGFVCSHSGTYRDPVTDKVRQYDIRAQQDVGNVTLAMAVECKNLRPNNPLLLSAVPRTPREAFHKVVFYHSGHEDYPEVRHRPGDSARYKTGQMVGRKTDQVGRDESGSLVSNDETTFDKLNQAVNSCRDLVQQLVPKNRFPFRRVIAPVLVVPSGLLWQVDYDGDGSVVQGPRQVPSSSLYYDHPWNGTFGARVYPYRLSHVEIVALDALAERAKIWLGPDGFVS